ncbi:MAG TPA: Hpt domain-containing protein, partial [Xanthobacteraceae bacterium]|nr:Hpt domain-containing protein [Xanthobacteraceae bacterium]
MADLAPGGDEYAQFRITFFEECTELLADLEQRLDQMQSNVAQAEELNAVFRAVHSIKAGAGAFKFVQLVEFCHSFEAVLDKLRSGRIAQDDRISAVLVRASDVLAALVEAAQANRTVA